MSKSESPMNFGESVWDDDPFVRALNLSAELGKVLGDIAASGHAPDENAGRVAELERELAEEREKFGRLANQLDDAFVERDEARERLFGLESNDDHISCYVTREVPWTDVAAGMMTIARDGAAWMVETWRDVITVRLRNGDRTFDKTPVDDETVRVLVPYVTPEQAQALVASKLGGRA